VVALRVVNAPSRGAITGNIYSLDTTTGLQHQTMGTMEFHAADGSLASSQSIQNYNTDTYLAAYLAPGTYRVRYVPMMGTLSPQWWPNQTTFGKAADVVVTAGQTVPGLDFFLLPAAPTVLIPAPSFGPSGVPSFALPTTTAGKTYILEFVRTLGDQGWQEVTRAAGDGAPKTLSDAANGDPSRFYRLRME